MTTRVPFNIDPGDCPTVRRYPRTLAEAFRHLDPSYAEWVEDGTGRTPPHPASPEPEPTDVGRALRLFGPVVACLRKIAS